MAGLTNKKTELSVFFYSEKSAVQNFKLINEFKFSTLLSTFYHHFFGAIHEQMAKFL